MHRKREGGTTAVWVNWSKAHGQKLESRQFRLLNLWLDKQASRTSNSMLSEICHSRDCYVLIQTEYADSFLGLLAKTRKKSSIYETQ